MRAYLTIQEAAYTLGLHPQTIYRKCQKNELACVRFGRTIRIPADQFEAKKTRSNEGEPIPSFMTHLFWEYDATRFKSSDSIVLERILELGDLPEWRWLQSHVEPHQIRHFLQHVGRRRLSTKTLSFWSKLLGV